MVPELALNVLSFFDRPMLEGLQIYSRFLRDIVDDNARILPLRCISFLEVRIFQCKLTIVYEVFRNPAPRPRIHVSPRVVHRIRDYQEKAFDICSDLQLLMIRSLGRVHGMVWSRRVREQHDS